MIRSPYIQAVVGGLSTAGALILSQASAAVALAHGVNNVLAALIATLAFAVPQMTLIAPTTIRHLNEAPTVAAECVFVVVGGLAAYVGIAALETATKLPGVLYCSPGIPWRVEIAVFGGFAVGLLETMLYRRERTTALGPLIYLGIFWIAPWYGFFSPPLFVGEAFAYRCAGQSLLLVALAFGAMAIANLGGSRLGVWLQSR